MGYKDKEKQRNYQRNWIKKRRNDFFKNKTCQDCSSEENLELHHVDPLTKEDHSIWSWKTERQEKEIEKCIILCRECHQRKHGKPTDSELLESIKKYSKEHGTPPVHGEKSLIAGSSTYKRRFGSWNKAIIASGIQPRKSSRSKYNKQA